MRTLLHNKLSVSTNFLLIISALCISKVSFAQVDVVVNKMLLLNINGATLKIPYLTNRDLTVPNNDISSAVVVIHGNNRNADVYFENMSTAAAMRPGVTNTTVIVAPQFLTEEDIDFHNLDEEHLYWTSGGWKSGSNSRDEATNPRPERIPSYAVLDSLMIQIATNFPNLRSLIFTGHSAGGQVATRYAATSLIFETLRDQFQVCAKFIVANPSSYVYMDERRIVDGTTNQFAAPDASDCLDYNEWKYGLSDLFTYPSNTGATKIRNLLKSRRVVYLLGEDDNNPNSSSLDTSCPAMLQGKHRLERGVIYFNHLQDYYGEEILEFQSLDTVPDAGHSNLEMYTSDIGLFHLFESFPTSCEKVVSTSNPLLEFSPVIYPNPASDKLKIIGLGSGSFTVSIRTVQGKELLRTFNSSEVDISSLASGVYVITLQQRDTIVTYRIIKVD